MRRKENKHHGQKNTSKNREAWEEVGDASIVGISDLFGRTQAGTAKNRRGVPCRVWRRASKRSSRGQARATQRDANTSEPANEHARTATSNRARLPGLLRRTLPPMPNVRRYRESRISSERRGSPTVANDQQGFKCNLTNRKLRVKRLFACSRLLDGFSMR